MQSGRLFNGAVGDFNGLTIGTIASISFDIIGVEGVFAISPSGTTGDSGPWIDGVSFVDVVVPTYNAAFVRVVPVPAAVWLMLSGLGVLLGAGRRKSVA